MVFLSRLRPRTTAAAAAAAAARRQRRRGFSSMSAGDLSSSSSQQEHQREPQQQKVALVMGVANHRSIAWACVESLRHKNFQVILTCQNERTVKSLNKLLASDPGIMAALPCNVETDLPLLFEQQIPELLSSLQQQQKEETTTSFGTTCPPKLNAIVHSIAHANYGKESDSTNDSSSSTLNISNATWEDFQHAQQISAFSLLETAKYAKPLLCNNYPQPEHHNVSDSNTGTAGTEGSSGSGSSSITALTYLGAVRAAPNYHLMGPAKASLEACVRGLAAELGPSPYQCRVNAVSAGPLRTLSARGIPHFTKLYNHVQEKAPLQRSVTQQEVANTVAFLATEGTGITGQTVYVDAGYSSVIPL